MKKLTAHVVASNCFLIAATLSLVVAVLDMIDGQLGAGLWHILLVFVFLLLRFTIKRKL